jgi:hypothetical protein
MEDIIYTVDLFKISIFESHNKGTRCFHVLFSIITDNSPFVSGHGITLEEAFLDIESKRMYPISGLVDDLRNDLRIIKISDHIKDDLATAEKWHKTGITLEGDVFWSLFPFRIHWGFDSNPRENFLRCFLDIYTEDNCWATLGKYNSMQDAADSLLNRVACFQKAVEPFQLLQ